MMQNGEGVSREGNASHDLLTSVCDAILPPLEDTLSALRAVRQLASELKSTRREIMERMNQSSPSRCLNCHGSVSPGAQPRAQHKRATKRATPKRKKSTATKTGTKLDPAGHEDGIHELAMGLMDGHLDMQTTNPMFESDSVGLGQKAVMPIYGINPHQDDIMRAQKQNRSYLERLRERFTPVLETMSALRPGFVDKQDVMLLSDLQNKVEEKMIEVAEFFPAPPDVTYDAAKCRWEGRGGQNIWGASYPYGPRSVLQAYYKMLENLYGYETLEGNLRYDDERQVTNAQDCADLLMKLANCSENWTICMDTDTQSWELIYHDERDNKCWLLASLEVMTWDNLILRLVACVMAMKRYSEFPGMMQR